MLKEENKEMQKNLDKLYGNNILKDKQIVVFGSNEPAERMADWLLQHNIQPYAMADNNKKKQGMSYRGIQVDSPENIFGDFNDNVAVLIASKYYNEMVQQLEIMGYSEDRHIFKIVNMSKESIYSVTEETFQEKEKEIRKGFDIYIKIRKKYGNKIKIFICPFPALGDVYLVGRYLEKYCKKNNISSYIVTIAGEACIKVLSLFGISKTEKLSKEESYLLMQSVIFAGLEECNVMILHHRFPYTAGIGVLGNYKGICFNDHYKYSIFGMDEKETGKLPGKVMDITYIDNFFRENGLVKGKTVIMSPYANTSAGFPESFWKNIVKQYQDEGYIVCTNSSGIEEPAIEGTKAIYFSLAEAIQVVEAAGVFIGLRSGLCDVVSSAKARKIILYPDRIYQEGKYIEFYSLEQMGLCTDAEEKVVKDEFL